MKYGFRGFNTLYIMINIAPMIRKIEEFFQKFARKEKGEVELSHGTHEILIPVKRFHPSHIIIELDECNIGNCSNSGSSDSFDTSIVLNNFILKAVVNSDRRRVKWTAIR
jgi:hypothetical protein